MRQVVLISCLSVTALLSACASELRAPPKSGSASPVEPVIDESIKAAVVALPELSGDDIICRRERVTGTHQKREVCATRARRGADRREAQDWHRSGGLRGGVSAVPTVR